MFGENTFECLDCVDVAGGEGLSDVELGLELVESGGLLLLNELGFRVPRGAFSCDGFLAQVEELGKLGI